MLGSVATDPLLQPFPNDVVTVLPGFPERAPPAFQQIPFSILELVCIIPSQKILN